ncbi:MAG: PAS domain-containing sensor histidine kinase, partial [Deltaproteobacteria bacterium]
MMDYGSEMVKAILDALEDGIYIINQDYILEFMNRAMVEEFGEGTGGKCYNVINEFEEVCPWCKAQQVFAGERLRWEHYVPVRDKTYELTEVPLRDGDRTALKLTICRDITLRKLREEKIRATQEDYRRLFENARSGLYVSSKEGRFLNANKALLDMLGYESKEEFLGIDIARDLYLDPEDRIKFMEMIEKDGYVIDYEVNFKRKDGTPIPVLLTSHVRYD